MIRIPEGNFIYGEEDWLDYFKYLPDYWISKTPVTNFQYFRFVKETGHDLPKHWDGKPPKVKIADHPVVQVNWHDVKAYADWVGMDLPTEQEWEKASRGLDGRTYPWGDSWREQACNTLDMGIGGTTPVGKFSPDGDSPYGCVDMSGNVWEYAFDQYSSNFYYSSPKNNPQKGVGNPSYPDNEYVENVIRGGAFWAASGDWTAHSKVASTRRFFIVPS